MSGTNRGGISSRARAFVPLLVALLLCSVAATAHGDALAHPTNPIAREHLTAGNRLYRVREFEKAIEEYKAGALRESATVFHYNLGQCYRQLGRYEDALWHYERFLERGKPTGEVEKVTRSFIDQMRSELEKKAMTQPPVEPAPPPLATTASSGQPTILRNEASFVAERSPRWYEDTLGWGMAGSGAITAAVAGWMLLSGSALHDEANAEPNQRRQAELRDTADTRRLLGTVIGAGGAALMITGVVKLAIHERRQPTLGVGLGVGSSGLTLVARF